MLFIFHNVISDNKDIALLFINSALWDRLIITPDFTIDSLKSEQFFAYLEVMTCFGDEPY